MAEDELLQDPVLKAAFLRGRASSTTMASTTVDPQLPTRQVSTSTMMSTAERVSGFKIRPRSRPINSTPIATALVTLQHQVNVFPSFSYWSGTERSHALWHTPNSLANTAASGNLSMFRSNSGRVASHEPMRFMTETKVKDKTTDNNKKEKFEKMLEKVMVLKAETTAQQHRSLKHSGLSQKKNPFPHLGPCPLLWYPTYRVLRCLLP